MLKASATKNLVYLALATNPSPDVDPGPYTAAKYPDFIGKLDLASRWLSLVEGSPLNIAIDPEAEVVYRTRVDSVERVDFQGNVIAQWRVDVGSEAGSLAPDGKSLLIVPVLGGGLGLLDLTTGEQTRLPIDGRAAVLGGRGNIYFIREAKRQNGVLETLLYHFQVGQKAPTRLMFVSCKRVGNPGYLMGRQPALSADGTWLVWPLPVEWSESGTLLVDLTNHQYRVLEGDWMGVQWHGRPQSIEEDGLRQRAPGDDFSEPSTPPDPPPLGAPAPAVGRSTLVPAPFLEGSRDAAAQNGVLRQGRSPPMSPAALA